MSRGALARVVREAGARKAAQEECCELCGEEVPADHRHVFDGDRETLLCACRPCSLLFVRDGAGAGRYLLVPRRRARLAEVPTTDLGIPVGLAFFVPRAGGVIAHYPSPAGATRWEVDPRAWAEVVDTCPDLGTLERDVEALLVHTARGRKEHWIVPVDDCFRMVAVVRREWRGLSGGSRVWPAIDGFFAELTERR